MPGFLLGDIACALPVCDALPFHIVACALPSLPLRPLPRLLVRNIRTQVGLMAILANLLLPHYNYTDGALTTPLLQHAVALRSCLLSRIETRQAGPPR